MKYTKEEIEKFGKDIANELNDVVFNNIYNYLREHPNERKNLNPAFPFPKNLRIGILKDFLAIEYVGPEEKGESQFLTQIIYNENFSIYDFLDMDISHTKSPSLGVPENILNMNFFLDRSIEHLCDYFYDFTQLKEDVMLNGYIDFTSLKNQCILNNCTFFYTDRNESLKIRHIDLLEIYPLLDEGIGYQSNDSLRRFCQYIILCKLPSYDIELHKYLNKFIELINMADTTEPKITAFIEEHPELLQVAFGFKSLNPQKDLIWQDNSGRKNLRPDFLPESMDGYCNILDFKMPYLKSNAIVGKAERQHPSYEIDEYIAQLDSYEEYCAQNVNKDWLSKTYNIKIEAPQRFIIMGHSKDFTPQERQMIRKKRNTVFFTYDEFIEMARFQIYRIR